MVVVDKKRRTCKIIDFAVLEDNRLKKTGITAEIGQVQRTVLLGMAGILRKVLEI